MKKRRLSPDDQEWWFALARVHLAKWFKIVRYDDIDYGCQLKMRTGEVVNLYSTGKFSLGGKFNRNLKAIMTHIQAKFESTLK